jgi:hypothetical protein
LKKISEKRHQRKSGGGGSGLWFERSPFQFAFAQIKEEWQGERHADGENGDEGQPAAGDAETEIFKTDVEQKRDRRNEGIHAKKGANAVGEKLLEEEREIQAVCGDPREKLPVRENDPENTEQEIGDFTIHERVRDESFARGG